MSYVISQVSSGTAYWDVTADAEKTDGAAWQIMDSTVTKIFSIDTGTTNKDGSWRTAPNFGNFRRAGYPFFVARSIASALNTLGA